jgi:hypothetical protein
MMTAFTKTNLEFDGMYLMYQGKFVARFKRGASGTFITFLIKNFTVEEYFARREAGEAPLTIAESKGYLLPHIKKWLKQGGYPVTVAGFKQMVEDSVARKYA